MDASDPEPPKSEQEPDAVAAKQVREMLRARRQAYNEAQLQKATELNRQTRDGALLFMVAAGFGALGVIVLVIGSYFPYRGPGFSPYETMSVFAFSAAGVMGFWGMIKISGSIR